MQMSTAEFRKFIHDYEPDELFYRDLYLAEKEHPETFAAYCQRLDSQLIKRHSLYVPALCSQGWYTYVDEHYAFQDFTGNILLRKHYRYSPVYIHEHEFFELLCIYEGTAQTEIQGISRVLTAGDICLIPPNTKHSVSIFDDSIAINILIRSSTFQSGFFQLLTQYSALTQFFTHVLYQKTEGNFLIFHTKNDNIVIESLEGLFIEYLSQDKYSDTILYSMLITFLGQLLRYHENHIESILTSKTTGGSMSEILNYLNSNYRTATLKETAAHFGYSVSHFSTIIKEGTGCTFLQIIQSIKLNQACLALRKTDLPIPAICQMAGYETPEHFMRLFKKTYGITPGEYRKHSCSSDSHSS